jgi:PAS domain S-box-containing protein
LCCQRWKEKIKRSKNTSKQLRFKSLIQEGSDLISIFDKAGNYCYTSPNIISLGIKPEDLEGHNVKEFIHPADIEQVLASLDKVQQKAKL